MPVTVYSTPSCPYCHLEKAWLKEQKIPFRDINVAADIAAAREMIRKSGQMGVPVTDVDGTIIVGFDEPALAEALNMKKRK